ncbi:unnamed protein product [Parnassius mnemosyne]|uniref:Envelope fusion protein n=1 Tax=Parnassius mnemosyne TaxID=213953 RepID=A0AAV1LNX7_9NEOP
MSMAQDFTMSSLIASNMLQNIKITQENLLETLTDIYHGQFNMHLLTAEQLREELHIISGHLTEDITLPIENIQQEVHKIYKLLKVKARMMQKYLIFEVIFPLLNRDKYKLYKIITIPHQVENNIETSIFPIAEYTAISLRKDTYLKITNKDLYLCLHEEDVYLCPIRQPIYHLSEDKNFCQLDQTTSRCRIYKTSCTNKWLPLNNPSQYLFHCCNTYDVKIICSDRVIGERLTKAGVISLDKGCLLKGQDFTLLSHQIYTHQIEMNKDLILPKIDPLNNIIKISIPLETFDENDTNLSDLNSSLHNLDRQIKDLKKNNVQLTTLSSHDIHHYAINYVLIGVAAVLAAVFVWRWRRRRRRAPISPDLELQSASSVSAVSARNQRKAYRKPSVFTVSASARNCDVDRQHMGNIGDVSCEIEKQNKACSPIPQRHFNI